MCETILSNWLHYFLLKIILSRPNYHKIVKKPNFIRSHIGARNPIWVYSPRKNIWPLNFRSDHNSILGHFPSLVLKSFYVILLKTLGHHAGLNTASLLLSILFIGWAKYRKLLLLTKRPWQLLRASDIFGDRPHGGQPCQLAVTLRHQLFTHRRDLGAMARDLLLDFLLLRLFRKFVYREHTVVIVRLRPLFVWN